MLEGTRVFLAHASEDKKSVRKLYGQLKKQGLQPWLDEENLIPGQLWTTEIPKAIQECDIFIACLSKNSIHKQGYVQKEFRIALDILAEKPSGSIFLIPLKLDNCEVPAIQLPQLGIDFRHIHWVDYWRSDGLARLLKAIHKKQTYGNSSPDANGKPGWVLPVSVASALMFIAVLLPLAVFIPQPRIVFRIVLALAAAAFGATIPGFFKIKLPLPAKGLLHAGGALGLFALIYLVNPPSFISSLKTDPSSNVFYGIVDTPQEIVINSKYTVEIQNIHVVKGEPVIRGQLLLKLSSIELTLKINVISHQLDLLKAQKDVDKVELKSKIAQLYAKKNAEITKANHRIQELEDDIDGGENNSHPIIMKIERLKMELSSDLKLLDIQIDLQKQILDAADKPMGIRINQFEKELAVLKREKSKLNIYSTIYGVIGSINYKVGEKVPPFASILTLHSKTPSIVKGYIKENQYLRVSEGDKLSISSLTDSHNKVTGYVVVVGDQIIEYPVRLRKSSDFQVWGREITVKIPEANRLIFGEKVMLCMDGKKTLGDYIRSKFDDPDDPGNLKLTTGEIYSKFIDNATAGRLFVVTGKIKSDYDKPRRFIHMTGKLYTEGHKLAKTEIVYAGNIIPDKELKTWDINSMKKCLADRFWEDQKALTIIQPGQTLTFMVIFSDLPKDPLEEFTIEVDKSTGV